MRNIEGAFLSGLSEKLLREKLFQKTETVLRGDSPLFLPHFTVEFGK